MKRLFLIIVLSMPFIVIAQDQKADEKRDWLNEKWAMKFDRNKDGKLDESEKQRADVLIKKYREAQKKRIAEHDKDADGKLNEDEKRAAKETNRLQEGKEREQKLKTFMEKIEKGEGEITKKFDADKDGKLNAHEKARAKEAIQAWFEQDKRKRKGRNRDKDRKKRGQDRHQPASAGDKPEDVFDGVL